MTKLIKGVIINFFLFQVLTLGRAPVHLYVNLPQVRGNMKKYLLLSANDDMKKAQRKQDITHKEKSYDFDDNVSSTFKASNNFEENSKRRTICLYSYKPGCIHIIPGY